MSLLSPENAAKAVSHPLRAAILRRLDGQVGSPAELAKEMGVSVGLLSYHVTALANLGALKLLRTKQVRGALEHFYTATVRIKVVQEPLDDPSSQASKT
jgi:DNA-binding transcriptional ArsR family regulator